MTDKSVAKPFNDFTGGLNLNQSTTIPDKCFTIATNVFYNNARQLQTRRGYKKLGNSIGNSPITSYFFYQRDDNGMRIAIAASGSHLYRYNETTGNRTSFADNLHEFETLPGITGNRTRWDFAVYKNSVYMCNGVDPYCAYDGTNYGQIDMGTPTAFTFDNTTDTLESVAHGLSNNDEVQLYTTGTFPTGVTPYQVYYVVNKTTDDFQISDIKNGAPITFTTNGTGTQTFSKLGQPRIRYIQYLGDRLYGAGDDGNPITLYYTNAAPASGNDISQNAVVIGGDENGIINGINEYNQLVLAMKSHKVYTVNVTSPSIQPIDAQTGGYADRTIQSVGNQLVYFNERGIDTLNKRYGVDGTGAIDSKPLSEYIRELIKLITPAQYNASTSNYIKSLNNYYFSFDTNDNNIPETTTVLNSSVGAWTQYNYPSIYDYGYYIDSDNVLSFVFASAVTGQMYQMEYGYDDDGSPIDWVAQTKNFDFNDPAAEKLFDFVDITGYKQVGPDVVVNVYVDGAIAAQSFITDSMLKLTVPSRVIGTNPIGIEPIGVSETDTLGDLPLYLYTIKVPFFARGSTISVNLAGSAVQHILEKMRISVDSEPYEVFEFNSIG